MQTRARILSIATAVPPHRLRQQDIAPAASRIFHSRNGFARFLPVYENAAIDTRYSCVPLSWYEKPSTLSERNALYLKHALDLLEKAARGALKRAHRTGAANFERHLGKRKDHDVANRHHGVTSDVGWGTV